MYLSIIKTLEKHLIKPTPMRMLVLEQLLVQDRNLSLAEIEEFLYPADRITIYRTLQTFVKKGLAHIIETAGNKQIYALCSSECVPGIHHDRHPHFHCLKCGKVTCTPDFDYSIHPTSDAVYTIKKVEVNMQGICPDCNRA
ncbi:MAG: transcriptional repressor [Cyclobacteriaceae bacterium]|nr:transcriptional repressor [Cyclobacteriaceae bacterium]